MTNGSGERIRKSDLDAILGVLDTLTRFRIYGRIPVDYSYNIMAGKYRLVRDGGGHEISPRLSKREMYDWMNAFINGMIELSRLNPELEVEIVHAN
jgi:hypothetical protein